MNKKYEDMTKEELIERLQKADRLLKEAIEGLAKHEIRDESFKMYVIAVLKQSNIEKISMSKENIKRYMTESYVKFSEVNDKKNIQVELKKRKQAKQPKKVN